MIYWLITFKDGAQGYQVMPDTLDNAVVTDLAGVVMQGPLEYTTTSTDQTGPVPAVTYA